MVEAGSASKPSDLNDVAGARTMAAVASAAGSVEAVAHAMEETAKTARASPRFAVTAMALVMSFGLTLAFIYLMSTRPTQDNPMPTAGNWMTQDQFIKALDEHGKTITPATAAALSALKTSVEQLRIEGDSRDRDRERQAKEMNNALIRIEGRLDSQGARIDRALERIEKVK